MTSAIDFVRTIFSGPPSVEPPDVACAVIRASQHLLSDNSRNDMAQSVCQALVDELPQLALAWIWFGTADAKCVQPLAYAGRAAAYAASLVIHSNAITRRGPVFRTLRGETVHAYQIGPSSWYEPWRRLATEYGICAVNVIPLAHGDANERGLLALYASDSAFFSTRNQRLFLEFGRLLGLVMVQARHAAMLVQAAEQDPLTGVLNRRGFLRAVSKCDTTGPWTLALVDVDHFKSINTTFGFLAGDRLLVDFASSVRAAIGETTVMARLGGDEFALLIPGDVESAGQREAQRILDRLTDKKSVSGSPITCSIGLAPFDPDLPLEELIARADRALRAAKEAGRNTIRLCERQ